AIPGPCHWWPAPCDAGHQRHSSVSCAGVGGVARGAIRLFRHRYRRPALDPFRSRLPGRRPVPRDPSEAPERNPACIRRRAYGARDAQCAARRDRGAGHRRRDRVAVAGVVWLASRRRDDFPAAAAIVIAGGVLAAPHALPADLALVALALAVWGQARWFDWLALSVAALFCAVAPAPAPAFVGIAVIAWACLRAAGLITWRSPGPVPVSAR